MMAGLSSTPLVELASGLARDGVVVLGQGSDDIEFTTSLRAAVVEASEDATGGVGLLVIDQTPAKLTGLRDVAEDVQRAGNEAGLVMPETVVVRAPGGVGATSMAYPRGNVDRATEAMAGEPDYPVSLHALSERLVEPSGPSGGVAVGGGIVVLAVGAVAAARATARSLRRGQGRDATRRHAGRRDRPTKAVGMTR